MTTIARIRCAWSGFVGAPGVSTFYCLDAATFRPDLLDFWAAINETFPTNVTITIPNTGDLVDDTTGANTGVWTDGSVVTQVGGTAGVYSAPTGAVVIWGTDTFLSGRRVQGRTFLVPLGGACFEDNGSISASVLGILNGAATGLPAATAGQQQLLHRPTLAGSPSGVTPGSSVPVTSARVPDLAAVLRSRRD